MLFHKPAAVPAVYPESGVTDFHSHILPGMDDGAADVETSLAMLRAMRRQGILRVVATPHFYPYREDPEKFLARRAHACARLLDAMREAGGGDLPDVLVGAEVAYYNGIGRSKELARLACVGTRTVLIEMPFSRWPDSVVGDLLNVRESRGLCPVVAHVERYIDEQPKGMLDALCAAGILIQANAEAFLERKTARAALYRLTHGQTDLLGTDAHNTDTRRPNLGDALHLLRQKAPGAEDAIAEASAGLLAGALPLAEVIAQTMAPAD